MEEKFAYALERFDLVGNVYEIDDDKVAIFYALDDKLESTDDYEVRFAQLNTGIANEHTYRITVSVRDHNNDFANILRRTAFAKDVELPMKQVAVDQFEVPEKYKVHGTVDYDKQTNTIVVMLTREDITEYEQQPCECEDHGKCNSDSEVKEQPEQEKRSSLSKLIDRLTGDDEQGECEEQSCERTGKPESNKTDLEKAGEKLGKSIDKYKPERYEYYWLNGKQVSKDEFDKQYPKFWHDFDEQWKEFDKSFSQMSKTFDSMNKYWSNLWK